jgi:BlaI family transcriptional regulator, penicillinase repressor
MQKLTAAEEEVMQYLWKLQRATVSQIIDHMPDPKPPHSTISSIMRILERKEAVDHKAYGRTYEYFPMITREAYSAGSLNKLATDYFGGSVRQMVSFLVQRDDLSLKDLEEIRQLLNQKNKES